MSCIALPKQEGTETFSMALEYAARAPSCIALPKQEGTETLLNPGIYWLAVVACIALPKQEGTETSNPLPRLLPPLVLHRTAQTRGH